MRDNSKLKIPLHLTQVIMGIAGNAAEMIQALGVHNRMIADSMSGIGISPFFAVVASEIASTGHYQWLPVSLDDMPGLRKLPAGLSLGRGQDYHMQAGLIVMRTGFEVATRLLPHSSLNKVEQVVSRESAVKSASLIGKFYNIDEAQLRQVCQSVREIFVAAFESTNPAVYLRSVIDAMKPQKEDKTILPVAIRGLPLADPRMSTTLMATGSVLAVLGVLGEAFEGQPKTVESGQHARGALVRFTRPAGASRWDAYLRHLRN